VVSWYAFVYNLRKVSINVKISSKILYVHKSRKMAMAIERSPSNLHPISRAFIRDGGDHQFDSSIVGTPSIIRFAVLALQAAFSTVV
jgi:hypothetical protein